jgi:hypothetical protein
MHHAVFLFLPVTVPAETKRELSLEEQLNVGFVVSARHCLLACIRGAAYTV